MAKWSTVHVNLPILFIAGNAPQKKKKKKKKRRRKKKKEKTIKTTKYGHNPGRN